MPNCPANRDTEGGYRRRHVSRRNSVGRNALESCQASAPAPSEQFSRMNDPAPITQQQPHPLPLPTAAVSYLHDAEQLRGEIEVAMLLISGNRLSALEESLWRQQVLCTSLQHLSRALTAEAIEPPLARRIREASLALQQLTRSYSVLIGQSSQNNDLLLRLCRSYQESAPSTSSSTITGATARSWSCEA